MVRLRLFFTFQLLWVLLGATAGLAVGFDVNQFSPARFSHLTPDDGLVSNRVFSIFQDSDDFLWFGTQDGLVHYDGYNFRTYQHEANHDSTLVSSYIQVIYEDRRGEMWIGTAEGLDRFDPVQERAFHYPDTTLGTTAESGMSVWAIHEDQRGRLWVGTDQGLRVYDPSRERFFQYQRERDNPASLSRNRVFCIFEDSRGSIWVGTANGLNRVVDAYTDDVDESGRPALRFERFMHDLSDSLSISHNRIMSIFEDQAGVLWIGTWGGGLNRFERETGHFRHFISDPTDARSLSSNTITSIVEDHFGNLWIGTNGGGLNELDAERRFFQRYSHDPLDPGSLCSDRVWGLHVDRAGVLWVGTAGGGISKLNRHLRKFQHFFHDPADSNTIDDNNVWSILKNEEGYVWVGTDDGLNRVDRQENRVWHYHHESDDPGSINPGGVLALTMDHFGRLWAGTYIGGLHRLVPGANGSLHPDTVRFVSYQHEMGTRTGLSDNLVGTLFCDRDGVLWVGTFAGGLNRLVPPNPQAADQSVRFTQFRHREDDPASLSHNSVWSIHQGHDGTLWVGTYAGLNRLITHENANDDTVYTFEVFRHDPDNPNSLSHDSVWCIFEDSSGILWVGTDDGLNRFDPVANVWRHFTEEDGLPDKVIWGLTGDAQGRLWISTNNGLCVFDPATEVFKSYDMQDGLQHLAFNSGSFFRSRDGELFFGGKNGFNAFFPDRVQDDPFEPAVVITRFLRFDEPVLFDQALLDDEPIELTFRDHFIAFEFAALDYTNPDRNLYAYQLEGFDTDWIYSEHRRYASYTNLAAGEYVFRVKGTNSDGVWSSHQAALSIVVDAPFWEAWWFRLGVGFVLVASLFLVYRGWLVTSQKRHLEVDIAERTRDLQWRTEELQQRTRELEESHQKIMILSEIGQKITATLEVNKILMVLYKNVNALMDATLFGMGFYDREQGVLDFRFTIKHGQRGASFSVPLDDPASLSAWCLKHRQEVLISERDMDVQHVLNIATETEYSLFDASQPPQSAIYLPLVVEPRQIGVVVVQSFRRHAYTDYHVRILKTLAAYTAIALDNANAYERVNQLNESLEIEKQRIIQAHLELKATQNQLVQAEKMASLGQLTAGVAHEIKNPLNFVNNFAEISIELCQEISDNFEAAVQGEVKARGEITAVLSDLSLNLRKIVEHGQRADEIVKGMLLHARPGSRERNWVDLNALAEQYMKLGYHGFRAKETAFHITMESDFDPSVGEVYVVPQNISRVLLNIIDNGCYATHLKKEKMDATYEPKIRVSTKNLGNAVEIRIRDNGMGMTDDQVRKIFDPFFTTKPAGSGTGLGLSICYDIIVNGHDGDIHVNTESGKFTEFVLRLPRQPNLNPDNELEDA